MKQALSLVLISTLSLQACATGRPLALVTVPGPLSHHEEQNPTEIWRQFAERLPIGSMVRVRTSAGPPVTGTLLIVDSDALTLNPKVRVAEPTRRIPFDEIEEIETARDDSKQLGKAIAIGMGVGGATFLGLLMLLFSAYD